VKIQMAATVEKIDNIEKIHDDFSSTKASELNARELESTSESGNKCI
jgi:hypothetical protein